MPKVTQWGLSDDSEPDDLAAFEPYDGEDPPKGVYIWRLTNFRVKANKNDDLMLNGLLILQDDRPRKKEYNGFPLWFNQNITDQGKPYVKQFLNAVGLSWNDLLNKTIVEGKMPKSNEDDPVAITKIGNLRFDADDVLVRATCRVRKDGSEDMEVGSFLEWKDPDDMEDSDGDGVEPEEAAEEEPAADEGDVWTREELEEMDLDGLKEVLDDNGMEYDADREDEDYFIAVILEEEIPDPPAPVRTATKKTAAKKAAPAKKTAAKKATAGRGRSPF